MIATHDSYTYQKPKNIFMNLIKIFWKCQKVDIDKQYELGTRIFDVRVASYKDKKDNNKIKWQTAHGMAKFRIKFDTIESICELFYNKYPGSVLRIYLEDSKVVPEIREEYKRQCDEAFTKYKDMLWDMGTHHPWVSSHYNKHYDIKEYYCHLFNWNTDRDIKYNLKNFDWTSWSLPYYAKKHNPVITKEMIEDPKTMYILDYIGVYPKRL